MTLLSIGSADRSQGSSSLSRARGYPSAPSDLTEPSDFFYVWLRRSLGRIYPDLFATLLTPKARELVATPHRFTRAEQGGERTPAEAKSAARRHFEKGLGDAFALMRQRASPDVPMTLYYAFKQTESRRGANGSTAAISTGWETMLSGLIAQGFQVTGTWPMRTERSARMIQIGTNALASSVVLVCRLRPEDAALATRREFLQELREELPQHLSVLMGGRVGPVDFAQAAIGPGMAVFTRYSKVLEADGGEMTVRTALELINEAIEAYLSEQEGALDRDSQFCVRWFEEHRFDDGPFGGADNLARAKNVGVEALAQDGVLVSRGGNVRLQPLSYYREGVAEYDPAADARPTTWEACHYLIAALDAGGDQEAGRLARRLGGLAEQARELAYRLYAICERKDWSEEALGYNRIVASWTEIREGGEHAEDTQARLV